MLGNGSLLATVSERGAIDGLWWPHPDRTQHAVSLRVGIELEGSVRWLDEEPFEWTQMYDEGTLVLRTLGRSPSFDVELEDVVHVSEPVLLRRVMCSAPRARVVVDNTHVTASLAVETRDSVVACALGSSAEEAGSLAERFLGAFDQVAAERRRDDGSRLAAAEPALRPSGQALYERSLLVFDALADRETGAVIAAPELDPDFVHSGGYGFVWPRDLAFGVLAFLASGRRDLAGRALRWFPRAQEPTGLWLQRHWTDGSLAPSWCVHQLDETGSVLFAYDAAWRALHDDELDSELWPSARRAADFLLDAIDDSGLPAETADLWEERDGRHAYTAAATVAGLRSAAAFAERHEQELADGYATAAERVREALERSFWSDEHGRYLRTIGDPTVDASLLGLAWPFRAVDPRGPRMRATAAAVERVLGRPGGGILRYDGDSYAGGNPWVLAALWLGLWARQTGDEQGLRRALSYAERVATPLGLLAEQVSDDGRPAWVLPLAWSHAMFVLASRPELELVRAPLAAAAAPPLRVTP